MTTGGIAAHAAFSGSRTSSRIPDRAELRGLTERPLEFGPRGQQGTGRPPDTYRPCFPSCVTCAGMTGKALRPRRSLDALISVVTLRRGGSD